jgi:hypothetical protein
MISSNHSYSTYTHIYQLAQEIKKGVESADPNIQVELYQVAETLPQEVLDKMYAPPKPDIPLITGKFHLNSSTMFNIYFRFVITSFFFVF